MPEPTSEGTFLSSYEDHPALELTATKQVFPCTFPNSRQVLIHLSRPEKNLSILNLYQAGGMKMRVLGNNKLEMIGEDLSYCRPFFDRHFLQMTKADGSSFKKPSGRDAQLDWIHRHRGLQIEEEVVRNGFLFVNSSSEEKEALSSDELEDDLGGAIRMYVRTYDEARFAVERVYMTHHHRELTEMDNIKWQRATGRSEMDTEQSEFKRKENYSLIADLYRALFTSVDGVLIDGVPCTLENQSGWSVRIPFNWMYLAVSRSFQGTTLKNE